MGAGGGAHTWFLCREGFDVYAFDGAPSAIKETEQYLQRENLHADLKVRDAVCLDYNVSFFDCIIDNVSIYANMLINIESMYSECYRLLKPNGKILTVVFGKETDGFGTGQKLEEDTYQKIDNVNLAERGIIHFFDNESIRGLLSEIGFNNIQVDTIEYTDRGVKIQQLVCSAQKS